MGDRIGIGNEANQRTRSSPDPADSAADLRVCIIYCEYRSAFGQQVWPLVTGYSKNSMICSSKLALAVAAGLEVTSRMRKADRRTKFVAS